MPKMLDFKLQAVGVNGLVRLTRLVSDVESRAQIKFRELNARYKPTLMARFLTELKISCDTKGAAMRPAGHKKIKNSLYITSGGLGSGRSAFHVRVAGPAANFARIYDKGGIITPKPGTRFLAVPLSSLKSLSLTTSGKSAREVLSLLQASGVQTATIPLNRHGQTDDYQLGGQGEFDSTTGSYKSFSGKLIVGKFKISGPNRSVKIKQVGLYALIYQVSVKPSYWLRDGIESFVSQQAVPLLMQGAKQLSAQLSNFK